MPVVTAAVAAVSIAVATTTVATVAAAVVAVSTVVGVAGLAVTAVGMVTKNQDLLKVGKIMGFVGLAGGIAGGIAGSMAVGPAQFASQMSQTYSKAWNDGLGKLFSPAADGVVGGQKLTGLDVTAKNVLGAPQAVPSSSTVTPASSVPSAAPSSATPTLASAPSGAPGTGPGMVGVSTPPPPPAPAAPVAVAEQAYRSSLMDAAVAPSLRTVPPGAGMQGAFATPGVQAPLGSQFSLANTAAGITPPLPTQSLGDWFKNMSPNMQASLAMVGGQGLAGAMGGFFEGRSAEERMELERLIAEQAERQRQFERTNMTTSPLIQFAPRPRPVGLLNTVGGSA